MTFADMPGQPNPADRLLAVIFERFARTGEWPVVDELRHELDMADDDLDVMALGRELDPNLGTVGISHGDRARLTIHGVARCPGSREVLADLLRAMQLAYERFRTFGIHATFGSDDLLKDHELSPLRVRRTYELMWPLPGIGGGTGASEETWTRNITSDITVFKRVHMIEGLIAAAPAPPRSSQPQPQPQPQPEPQPKSVARATTGATVGPSTTIAQPDPLSGLHSRVIDVAGALFRDGHYAQASFQAFKALEVALRERSGLDLSGRELAEKALGGSHPKVVVSRHAGRTGADEQEGVRFLFMGTMQGLRNPGGHELDVRDRQEALEEIAIASLLMRWLAYEPRGCEFVGTGSPEPPFPNAAHVARR